MLPIAFVGVKLQDIPKRRQYNSHVQGSNSAKYDLYYFVRGFLRTGC